jgi:epoxide hydrolase-like predicted phosphatase
MIKAIAFDYGGVIELNEGDLIQEIADLLHTTKDDWKKVYFTLNHLANTGKVSRLEIHKLVAEKLGASEDQIISVLDLVNRHDNSSVLNIGLIEIIKYLRSKNYKIGLLSNYSGTLRGKLAEQKIADLFDAIIISSEVGFQKPQPEIFEILFKGLGVKNNETIFIDDTQKSLENAEEIGYTPILYVDNEKLSKELSGLL